MLLGELIESFQDEGRAEQALLSTGDLCLIADARRNAAEEGVSIGTYLSDVIAGFTTHAGDEAWMAVVSAASRSDNPGAACLRTMIEQFGRLHSGACHDCG